MKVPDGYPLVKGRFVTGFANSGEAAIELMQVVPFLVEDMLKRTAASIRKRPTGHPHVVVDGNPITGQNPASAQGSGRAVLQRLAADAAPSKERQVRWREAGRLEPLVAKVFPLPEAGEALTALLSRRFAGKIVLET